MTDLPTNLAQACEAWARIEAHLIEHCGLGQGALLERERPALIRLTLTALEGLPAPVTIHASSTVLECRGSPPLPLHNPTPPAPPQFVAEPRWVAGGVWFNGFDLPAPDPAKARTDGPGYDCRACGVRVKRGRHVDPRLLCPACRLLDTAQ
jgi:hypothetical protein